MDDLAQIYQEVAHRPVSLTVDGVTSYIAAEDGKLISGTVQDCTPILEAAAQRRAAGAVGSRDMRCTASFPTQVVETYCNVHGITLADWFQDPIHARRMVNDPDLSGFRVWDGKSDFI